MNREKAIAEIYQWAIEVLRDYDVPEEIARNDPELHDSVVALLDQLERQ